MLAVRKEPAHLALLFVQGAYHGRGIGTRLFQRMAEDFSGRSLTVNAAPSAVGFYERLGFRATAEEQTVHGISFVPMRLEGL